MVAAAFSYLRRAIDLLDEQQPRNLVWKGQRAEAEQSFTLLRFQLRRKAVGAANKEGEPAATGLEAIVEPIGELR